MKMKQENWEPCPRCGSKQVRVFSKLPAASFSLVLGAITLIVSLPWVILFPPGGILGVIFGISFMISQRFINKKAGVHEYKYICETCKFKFNPASQELELQQQS